MRRKETKKILQQKRKEIEIEFSRNFLKCSRNRNRIKMGKIENKTKIKKECRKKMEGENI